MVLSVVCPSQCYSCILYPPCSLCQSVWQQTTYPPPQNDNNSSKEATAPSIMDSLTVTISSPTHTPHTFTLSLGRQCSILELKEIIAARLDSKPTIADQRLIFGGYVLDDKDTLERVFEKVDCSHSPPTIHVVVSHRLHTSAPASPSPLRFRTNSESTTAITPPSPRVTGNMTTAATSGTNLNTHSFAPFANTAAHQGNRAESGTSSTHSAEPPLFAAGQLPAMSAPFYPAQSSSMQQPMQYVIVNGMPYLVPAASLPILHHQHCMQQAHHFSPYSYYGAFAVNAEGTPYFHHAPPAGMGDHAHVGTGPGQGAVAAVAADGNVQDNAARDQRRAASLWLLMKLAFGVYLFSQNGSIERIVLLHVAAFIIFLHQTGRLRIVRRIGNPPGDAPQHPAPNAGQHAPAAAQQTHTTTATTTTTSVTSSDSNSPSNEHRSTSASASGTDINSTGNSGSSSGSSNIHTQSSSSQSRATATSSTSTAAPGSSGSQTAQTQQTQDTAQQQQQQPRVSTWRSIEHALLTFVTSLVPAPPPEIDPAVANAGAGDRGM